MEHYLSLIFANLIGPFLWKGRYSAVKVLHFLNAFLGVVWILLYDEKPLWFLKCFILNGKIIIVFVLQFDFCSAIGPRLYLLRTNTVLYIPCDFSFPCQISISTIQNN